MKKLKLKKIESLGLSNEFVSEKNLWMITRKK